MKFIVPNYGCLQNPWIGSYAPRSPFSLSSVLNWICWTTPEKNSWVRHCVLHGAFPHREALNLKKKKTMSVWIHEGKTAEIASSIIANRRQVHYSATAGSQSSLEIILLSVRVSAWVRVCEAIAFPSLSGPQGRAASCTLSEEPCHLASLGTHKLETSLHSSRTKETREAKLTGKHLLRQSRSKDITRIAGVLQEMAGRTQCTGILGGVGSAAGDGWTYTVHRDTRRCRQCCRRWLDVHSAPGY